MADDAGWAPFANDRCDADERSRLDIQEGLAEQESEQNRAEEAEAAAAAEELTRLKEEPSEVTRGMAIRGGVPSASEATPVAMPIDAEGGAEGIGDPGL